MAVINVVDIMLSKEHTFKEKEEHIELVWMIFPLIEMTETTLLDSNIATR